MSKNSYVLILCQINHDGSIDCNNGSLSFSVFETELTMDAVIGYLIYYDLTDLQNESLSEYITMLRDHAMCLLNAAGITDFFPTDMLLIAWKDYHYCTSQVSLSTNSNFC